jgi:hypothetical protein
MSVSRLLLLALGVAVLAWALRRSPDVTAPEWWSEPFGDA